MSFPFLIWPPFFFFPTSLGIKHLHAFRVVCNFNVSLSASSVLTPTILLKQCSYISVTQSCPTLCNPRDCRTPGFPVHHQLLEFAQTHVHWVGDAIQPSHPLLILLLLPSIFPSIRVFPNESALHIRWPEYWSFSFSISSSNECLGLISFRMDWFDLLAVQGTLKSLLQHHSPKASILWRSAFFMVQLSHICTWLLEKP